MDQRISDSFTIAVLGGRFSRAILAGKLLREAHPGNHGGVDRTGRVPTVRCGYSTQLAGHLLSVRARDMSALAEDPSHFLRPSREHYSAVPA